MSTEPRRLFLKTAAGAVVVLILGSPLYVLAARAGSNPPTWGQILIVGGETGRRDSDHVVELYNPLLNRFTLSRPRMRNERTGAAAIVIGLGSNRGKVLVAGGFADWGARQTTELYDPATNRFVRGPNLIDGLSAPAPRIPRPLFRRVPTSARF